MKPIKKKLLVSLVIAALVVITYSCKKEEVFIKAELTTSVVSYITEASAVTGGSISSDGGTDVTERGVCWSTSSNPTISDSKTSDAAGTGIYTSTITGLLPSTIYYVRAYAVNKAGANYGLQVTFTTKSLGITTNEVSDIKIDSALCGGYITTDGTGASVLSRGVCWSTFPNPTVANDTAYGGKGAGSFSASISKLTPLTVYYVRAYSKSKTGVLYGNEQMFTTSSGVIILSTNAVTSISATSATLSGAITFDGGAFITERGICYNTTANPTTSNSKTVIGSSIGSFSQAITGLLPAKTYYVRSYATNSVGTTYGNEVSFSTQNGVVSLTTSTATFITTTSAMLGGLITSDGGSPITDRGICYSTNQNPTISNNKIVIGSGTGTFSQTITGFSIAKTYYFRSYATNSIGTFYGNEESLTMLNGVISLTTDAATSISINSATLGGNVNTDGGISITERGICYSTTANPTTANNKVLIGIGTGSFSQTITGLSIAKTYFVRSFATNSVGTFYGNEVSFATLGTTLIPAGSFMMGSPTSEVGRSIEETQHQVTLSAYRINKYEITNEQYATFLNAKSIGSNGIFAGGAYPTRPLIYASTSSTDWGLHYSNSKWIPVIGYENSPVINVTWYGASEFASYVGGTLPTEAQWEYACRGGTSTPFSTGGCLTNLQANYYWSTIYSTCSNTTTVPLNKTVQIGLYSSNAYGLNDMHGNVNEWCADWYGTYLTTAQSNPTGAATGSTRVVRGGSWVNSPQACRSAYRDFDNPVYSSNNLGFRVVFAP